MKDMLTIDIVITSGHTHLIVEGHAPTAICNAVSAIMQTAAMGLAGIALMNQKTVELVQYVWPKENVALVRPDELRSKRSG